MIDFFRHLFDTTGFPPRWHCGLWTPAHGWLHILSDLGIWSAYYAIPFLLIYFISRRKDIPFPNLFWLFGAFILSCGTTHLLQAIIFWYPVYRFLGVTSLLTAILSWGTVLALIPVLPRALALRSPQQLEEEVRQRTAELAQANEALRQGEERLRLALEAGHMEYWDWDVETHRVTWSPGLEAIHGLPPGGFPGTFEAAESFIHPADRELLRKTFEGAVESGEDLHTEYRAIGSAGRLRWIELQGRFVRNADQTSPRMIGVAVDITERKRTENSLRFLADASRSLATLLDRRRALQSVTEQAVPSLADCCCVHLVGDQEGLQLAAASPQERAPTAAILPECRWRKPSCLGGPEQALRHGQPILWNEEADASGKTTGPKAGPQISAMRSCLCVPLMARERVLGTLTMVMIGTGRSFVEADLEIAQDLAYRVAMALENTRLYAEVREADRRKDQFLAMLAHELRTPLAPIQSALDLLSLRGVAPETVSLMQQQLHHLVRLVDDLLDVSRIMRGSIRLRKEVVALQDIVQRSVEAVRPLLDERRQQLSQDTPSTPIHLEADPVRLTQIITNLLNNAAKYTPAGGHIWLRTQVQGDKAVLSVRDNGIGIDHQLLPRIFELFTQADQSLDRSQGGLGLGLTLVRHLVEMHNGRIEARSEGAHQGSEFVVYLPIACGAPAPPPLSTVTVERGVARRILIVEDNLVAARMLASLLRELGPHEISLAHDGPTGLALALRLQPEVVLLDIGLPGLDGYEVAKQLRQAPQGDRPLVAAITGYGQEEDRQRSKAAGCDEHLLKPVSLESLQGLLQHPKLNRSRT